jgi:hypothetical protein
MCIFQAVPKAYDNVAMIECEKDYDDDAAVKQSVAPPATPANGSVIGEIQSDALADRG